MAVSALYYILTDTREPQSATLLEWGKWFQEDKRRVGYDEVGKVTVSTVFLGVDHRFTDGPPLLFETMIFGGAHDQYQTRCSTWAQAEAMHAAALALVRDRPDAEE